MVKCKEKGNNEKEGTDYTFFLRPRNSRVHASCATRLCWRAGRCDIGQTHMMLKVAGAGGAWRLSPGALAVSALADLSPARAPTTAARVSSGVFFFFFKLGW